MNSHDDWQREGLRDLATELGFSFDDQRLDTVLETAKGLQAPVDSSEDDRISDQLRRDSAGSMANDEYNALLDVYGEPRTDVESGPLDDLTVAIKDVIAVRDLKMTCGSEQFSCVPLTDAAVVSRMLSAGARLIGKANTDAFAFGPTGEFSELRDVVNPRAEDRVPGGSSSGSAAAVAGGVVDAALGTDTGGSVRIPAACCGVVGIKPTHTLVPRHGFVDLAPSTDTIGPLARDVATASRVLQIIAGPDIRDATAAHTVSQTLEGDLETGPDLAVGMPTSFLERSSERVTTVVREAASALEDDSDVRTVDDVDLPLGEIDVAYPLTIASEFAWVLRQSGVVRGQGTKYSEEWRQIFAMFKDSLNVHIAKRVLPAAYLDETTAGQSYVAARQEAIEFDRRLNELFERYDVLLVPTIRILPPRHGEVTATEGLSDITGNTGPFSLVGNPAVSVPVGDVDGVPVGVQIIASSFEDQTALRGARLLEQTVD